MGFSKLLSSVRFAQSTINLSKSVFARQCSGSGSSEACVCPKDEAGTGEPVCSCLYISGRIRIAYYARFGKRTKVFIRMHKLCYFTVRHYKIRNTYFWSRTQLKRSASVVNCLPLIIVQFRCTSSLEAWI